MDGMDGLINDDGMNEWMDNMDEWMKDGWMI